MKTKFDIGDNVYIKGCIKSIAVNEKGEIGYKVIINDDTGANAMIFDEDEIVEVSSKNYEKCNDSACYKFQMEVDE